MRRSRLRQGSVWLALVASTGVAACEPKIDLEAERAALLHTDESWAAAAEAGDLERVFSVWTEDAVIFPPVGEAVRGAEAIRAFVSAARAQEGFSLTWRPTGAEVSSAADVGYTYGSWRRTAPGPDGASATTVGDYLSIWRKQADGSWKCSIEISNLSAPPIPPMR